MHQHITQDPDGLWGDVSVHFDYVFLSLVVNKSYLTNSEAG